MLYTIDRVQLINNKLIFFEFYGQRDQDEKDFANLKVERLIEKSESLAISEIYGISYNYKNFQTCDKSICVKTFLNNPSKQLFSWPEYVSAFKQMNGYKDKSSKRLGSATDNEGDPYVSHILNEIHNINFLNDDNGLNITKQALKDTPTCGFDFDLFDDEQNCIIEFLKRESSFVDNLNAHPIRYLKNKQKFISLYNSSRILGGTLYLINYSDDESEPISVIEVIDYNVNTGVFIEDCGYRFNNKRHLIEWLILMNNDVEQAKMFLNQLAIEYRGPEFWANLSIDPKGTKRIIGKNYVMKAT